MLQKVTFYLGLVIIVVTILGFNIAHAQVLTLADVEGNTGETVGLNLVLSNNPDVASVDGSIRIADGAVAEFVILDPQTGEAMVEAGAALTGDQSTFGNVQPDGRLQIRVINSSPMVDPVAFNDGVLSVISLDITGEEGDESEVILEDVECADDFAVIVQCFVEAGFITVGVGPPNGGGGGTTSSCNTLSGPVSAFGASANLILILLPVAFAFGIIGIRKLRKR